ncbi:MULTISPECIES: BatD family protein [Aliiglaciecola]|uniref:BatD family protein n=1 Tax=Aliiglaciecola TaxID=1406885 RepID=UPI001C0992D4|nr:MULTISPECIES: BatD family protein [Aliiglaciecola]MBU2878040.1 BatD family protein [Aliiglaciecola lipolytica]MDO6709405.1 BatD family protein [Aliiglaciecola sp. 2_MG-2023]MDO6750553.1 BatD family protein [Aliiglaciecola sp. 1_MG-2023]
MLVKLLTRKTLLLTLLFFSLLSITNVYAQVESVTASVDKNPAMADESIVLSVVAFGNPNNDAFDPSVLEDDFVVGRTSVSTQTRVINFDTTRSTTWTTILIPRQQGTFTIPPFDVGGKKTQPITVRILPVSAASNSKAREAFITAEVDVGQPFVQQMVKYKVKIHLATSLQRGSLSEPSLENADISLIGKDKDYSEIVDGQRYRIIERNYAIIPQASGQVKIKGPLFEAEVIDRTQNSFSYFNQTRPINRVAPDVVLDVQPIPVDFNEHWLPSEFVQLNEEWQPDLSQIKVGEPITRTLTLSALGVSEQQLPEMTGIYPPDFKIYPDQATTASVTREDNIIAQRVENIAIIPNRAGQFVLPPVKVAWFNTLTKQTEYAELPARSIEVAAAASSNQTGLPPTSPNPLLETQAPASVDTQTPGPLTPTVQTVTVTSLWSISSWVLLAIWLLTLLIWWFSSRSKNAPPLAKQELNTNNLESENWKLLKAALKSHKIGEIYPALLKWQTSLAVYGGAKLLDENDISDSELQDELKSMFASQYAQGDKNWKSDTLLNVLARLRQDIIKNKNKSPSLQPLYASQRVAH